MYEVEMNAHPLKNKFEFDKLHSLTRVVDDASGKIELVVEGDEITDEGFEGPFDVYVLLVGLDQGEEYVTQHEDLLDKMQDAAVADSQGFTIINDSLVPSVFIAVPRGTEF